MTAELIITRRVPVFEFVVRTDQAVGANSELLERYIANQERPRGFVLMDPRLDGQVLGSTFLLHQHNAWMWGSMVPEIEGEIVPNDAGSDVVVQVRHGAGSLTVLGAVGLFAALSTLLFGGIDLETFGSLAFLSVVLAALGIVPVIFHGRVAAGQFRDIFKHGAAT